jgi:subfamily B ATP-binding cassette protein MsbA
MRSVDLQRLFSAAAAGNPVMRTWKAVLAVGALSPGGFIVFCALALMTALCETFGLALVYPLLTYIEAGGDVQKLVATSKLWPILVDVHYRVGVPVGFASLALGVWGLVVLRQSTTFLCSYVSSTVRERFAMQLRGLMFESVIRAKPAFLHDHTSGTIAGWFGQTVQQGANTVTIVGSAIILGCTILIYFLGLLAITPLATAAAVVLVGAFTWMLGRFVRSARETSRSFVRETEVYAGAVTSSLRNWRLVKLNAAEEREARSLAALAERPAALYLKHVLQAGRLQLIISPAIMAVLLIGIYVATGPLRLSLATVALFVVVIVRLTPAVEAIARMRQSLELSGAALGRVLDIVVKAKRQVESVGGTVAFRRPKKRIRFSEVTFAYKPDGPPALDRIDLDLPAASMIAIVGPSGAGKTTLVNALTRLVEPQSGSIFVDDVPLHSFSLSSLRRGIAMVDQGTQVLPGTIEANLRYANPNAGGKEIEDALRLAGVSEFVRQLPNGLATEVGEDGGLLSGGQRQRIALARAFLADASVIILDEPTSALDFEAEAAFRVGLQAIKSRGGATLLVIAHRPATIADADFVVVLRNGRIEEAAKPETLRHDPGYYRQMLEVAAGV